MIISKMVTKKDLDDKVTSMTSMSHGCRLVTKLFKYDNLNRPIECVSINHHDNDNMVDLITIYKNKYDKNNNVVYASTYKPIEDKFAEIYYVYNEYNKIISITKTSNDKSDFKDKFGNVYKVEKVDNKYYETTIFKYDKKGRIILVANTSVDLPNFEFKYEECGDIHRKIINYTTFVYGDSGLNVIDELEYIMRNPKVDEFKYDKNHNLVYKKYYNDKEKYMYYDENNNLIKEQEYCENKLTATSEYFYNDKNKIVKIKATPTDKDKAELIYTYDENDNLISVENESEKVILREYKYDKQGRLVKYSSFGYDYIFDYDGNIPWLEE